MSGSSRTGGTPTSLVVAVVVVLGLAAAVVLVVIRRQRQRQPAPSPAASTPATPQPTPQETLPSLEDLTAAPGGSAGGLGLETPAHLAEAVKRVDALRTAGEWDQAEAEVDRVLERDPDYVGGLRLRARLRKSRGDDRAALEDVNRWIGLLPEDGQAWAERALLWNRLEVPGRAEADLRRALELSPDDAEVWAAAGMVMSRTDGAGARQAAARALELDPNCVRGLLLRGALASMEGDVEVAINSLYRAVELEPSSVDGNCNLGTLLVQLGRAKESLPYLNQTLRLNPNAAPALIMRARVLHAMGHVDAALPDAELAVELSPGDTQARFSRALVYQGLKRHELALADYDVVLQVSNMEDAHLGRAEVLFELERWEEAKLECQAYLSISRDAPHRNLVEQMLERIELR